MLREGSLQITRSFPFNAFFKGTRSNFNSSDYPCKVWHLRHPFKTALDMYVVCSYFANSKLIILNCMILSKNDLHNAYARCRNIKKNQN